MTGARGAARERALRERVEKAATRPWSGTLYRCVTPRYARTADLVSGAGSARHGGRWNPRGLRAVYGCVVPETAVSEYLARARRAGLPLGPLLPVVLASIEVELERLLDLTDARTRAALELDLAPLLRAGWEQRASEAPSQVVGRAAHAAGLDGLRVPSAVDPERANLVVFPDRMRVPPRARGFEAVPHG